MCVCVCVHNVLIFVFLFYMICLRLRYKSIPMFIVTPLFFLLIYTHSTSNPAMLQYLCHTPTCYHPPFSPIAPTFHQPPSSLSFVSLASGRLIPPMAQSVPSLLHLTYQVSGECMPACPCCLRGEGCLISISLVEYAP